MTCDQADMEQERIYPASYPVAAAQVQLPAAADAAACAEARALTHLLGGAPADAANGAPLEAGQESGRLVDNVLPLGQRWPGANSSDGPVWEGDNEGEDDEEEQQKGMTGEEDDDEEEGGVFKLDGDDDDHAAHGGSIGSTPDLGMSDAEEDEFGLPFLDIDAGPGPCASAGAGSSAGPGAGAKFVLAGGGGDDDGGRSKGGGGPKGAGSKLLGHSWAGSAGSIPLGTSPILQMALRQLAAEGHAFDAKDLGAASQILRGFALPRQTTI
eukprot:CAMPEP_0203847396 /NCGR_PEP_ID=MMETSP0359-20131031/4989_1 /ASSEMBLY_ACC=CAM_ASM_000338 /TAXON_ID=268821 /ORGANISM="Scrippsiella Hangoei, Strain SHTV-5" /LENGTH=268 /DNA_ID=CAMNT_0050762849 /DNA_START=70 /DNA_END=876 /DNA_ORIENTATION=-